MNAMDHVVNEIREDLHGAISDTSKEAMGFRHRIDPNNFTTAELMAEYEYWCNRAEAAWAEEKAREAAVISDWEQTISDTMEMCNCNRFDAVYHALDGALESLKMTKEDIEWDPDYFCYLMGLPYRFDFIRGEQAPYNKFSTSNAWKRTA